MINNGDSIFKEAPIYLNIATEHKPRFHKHDFIEIVYVYSGRGTHIVGKESFEVAKGDLFIINHDITHTFIQNPKDEFGSFVVFNCVFFPSFIEPALIHSKDFKSITESLLFHSFFIEDKPSIHLSLDEEERIDIESIYKIMQIEYKLHGKGYLNILKSYLIILLTKIFRRLESNRELSYQTNQKYIIIETAINFLKENFTSNSITLEELALKSFLSRSYFSKIFKETTGQNFIEYLRNLRINEACRLLRTTNQSISTIMENVGFRDYSHFLKLFKKTTGQTPSEYKRGK